MSGGSWPKVILDPVHNLIPFEDNACDRLLWDLINTKEFQRLKRIKQLGVSEIVFPGANHSRFAHSIGVMHTARSFLVKIRQVQPNSLNEDLETLVLAAALIHDVGHGPFSHAFESITGDRHESRTLEIIRDESTEIHQCLKSYKAERDLPMKISLFFDESIEGDQLTAADVPPFLTQIVSSQLDADRFDYLQRDSHATGAEYGKFDVRWLIHHLNLDHQRGRFYLSAKALTAAEIYVFARYHMYRSVYFHKTTRAAEVMLRLIFKRFKKLVEQSGSICAAQAILPEAPASVLTAFSSRPKLSQYLALDDHSMTNSSKHVPPLTTNCFVSMGTDYSIGSSTRLSMSQTCRRRRLPISRSKPWTRSGTAVSTPNTRWSMTVLPTRRINPTIPTPKSRPVRSTSRLSSPAAKRSVMCRTALLR
jgi:HD superfamily phosphohydrolase